MQTTETNWRPRGDSNPRPLSLSSTSLAGNLPSDRSVGNQTAVCGPYVCIPSLDHAWFWARVNFEGPTPEHRPQLGPCWLWMRSTTKDGYGHFRRSGQDFYAHRFAFGPVADGLELDHLCRNRACCRPDHLEAVTHRINQARGLKGEFTTHCPRGHEYSPENTAHHPKAGRHCRTCDRLRHSSPATASAQLVGVPASGERHE